MGKVYKNENVYEAAVKRYRVVFGEFDNYYVSVSGGKDSSIMLQLMAHEARKQGKNFSVLYIDLEAQYKATIDHINELIDDTKDVVESWYWVALPLSLRNATSAIQPKWICWDKKDRDKWVREYPTKRKDVFLCTEDDFPKEWDWFFRGMEFEEFILYFAKWFNERHGGKTAVGVGIRSDESLNRFRTIISNTKEKYKDYQWTTRAHCKSNVLNCWNFFPLYDWRTEDDWIAVAKLDLKFNQIYELMYKNGLSIHEQRLCQPYGDDQRKGLDQFRALEPETWEKVLNRVEGVNFGNIYCRTSLLGNIKSEKPDSMTWEQYAVFLLESIGLYAPEVRDHYYAKICTFMKWYEKDGIMPGDIPDEADVKLESAKKVASWRRIARAIEKNDFWMSRLSFGETKKDVKRLFELKKKYTNIIRPQDTDNKHLKRVAEEMRDTDEYEAMAGIENHEYQRRKNMSKIENTMSELLNELQALNDEDKIDALNGIRQRLHEVSPFKDEPCDCVLWVKQENIQANEYNPNHVATPEMKLLYQSIKSDGYTMPIVTYDLQNGRREIVDGFHRNRIGREHKDVYDRIHGYLPVSTIDKPADERMGSTIRHNRARGTHGIRPMSDIVLDLSRQGWKDVKICDKLGMELDEVVRLKQITGLKEVFSNHEFSRSWEEFEHKYYAGENQNV